MAIQYLKDSIRAKNLEQTLEAMEQLHNALLTTPATLKEFLQPVVMAELHNLLEEHFEVPQRMMRIRRRVPVAKSRAILFLQAMKVALVKSRR
jgi:hypothetical protein